MMIEQTLKVGRGMTAVTAGEMGATLEGNVAAVPEELAADVESLLNETKATLVAYVDRNIRQATAPHGNGSGNGTVGHGVQPMAGAPVTGVNYEYWDLLTLSPQQFIFPPFTYRPHKIIAGGEFALLMAVLFINPLPSPGGGPSATQYLGGRPYRVRFEQIDLTNVTNGPDFTFVGVFPSPAPVITLFPVGIVPASPALNSQLMELNVTADVTLPGQPNAAFATQWIDLEADPGWPVPQAAGLRSQLPLRYLIHAG